MGRGLNCPMLWHHMAQPSKLISHIYRVVWKDGNEGLPSIIKLNEKTQINFKIQIIIGFVLKRFQLLQIGQEIGRLGQLP